MATEVNPRINPTNDPTYGTNSRAIDTPEGIRPQGVQQNQIMPEGQKIGDRSAEFEGLAQATAIQSEALAQKGYGDLFANLVGIGDFLGKAGVQLVRKDIETKVYEMADQERQQYTAELEAMLQGGKAKNLLDANASMDEVPEDIFELPDSLATLVSAKNAGKITKLDYQGRLLEKAKALRAQYPGFKQEIDAEFQKVTGQNPANARINSLITAINAQAGAGNKEANRVEAFYKANQGLPNMQKHYNEYLMGNITANQFYSQFTGYKQQEETMRFNKLKMDDVNLTRTEQDFRAKRAATQALGTSVAGIADEMLGDLGLTSPAEVQALNNAQSNGAIKQPKWDEAAIKIANRIARFQATAAVEMDRQGITAKLAGGADERNKLIAAQVDILKNLQQRVISKDFGGLYEAAQSSKLILDQGKNDMLKDSVAGPYAVLTNNLREVGGEKYAQDLTLKLVTMKGGIADANKQWFDGFVKRFNTNITDPNNPITLNDMHDEMIKKGINDNAARKAAVNEITKIGDSSVPEASAMSLSLSAFHPKNAGFLNKLKDDGSQNKTFNDWTTPEITNRHKQMGKKNIDIWNNYETWARDTGATLISKEVNNLAKITKDPNIKIEWSTENKRLEATRTWTNGFPNQRIGMTESEKALGGGAINEAREKQFQEVQKSLNRINNVLYSVKNVALESYREKDVDAYLLRTIHDANPGALSNIKSIPLEMLNKIMLGRAYDGSKR